ncbi:MAG: hypothetical protein AAGT88_01540 [Dethiobacter sp.]
MQSESGSGKEAKPVVQIIAAGRLVDCLARGDCNCFCSCGLLSKPTLQGRWGQEGASLLSAISVEMFMDILIT